MDLESFFGKSEFLYHLTDRRNCDIIIKSGILMSTVELVNASNLSDNEKSKLLRARRPSHVEIKIDNKSYYLRDQRPISVKNLEKCLTNNWTVSDFLFHLNRRVFFWPNLNRLERHYNRYVNENPVIIRVETRNMIELNPHAEYCRLNSGATRSSSHWNGGPPPRGAETFLHSDEYHLPPASIAEVTFLNNCKLPNIISVADTPNGVWQEVNLTSD